MARHKSRIAEVVAFLSGSPGTAKQKLLVGGKMLSAALMFADEWTPALQDKANGLKTSLLNGRKLDRAVEEMTEHSARAYLKQFSEDLAALAEEIDRAKRKRQAARTLPSAASSRRGPARRPARKP